MRRLSMILLACVSIAWVIPQTLGAEKPIPQDPARQEKAFRDLLAWNRATIGGAYEKVGKKNPKWDAAAREALEAAARMAGKAIDPASGPEDVFGPAKKAVEAGCDDPMILFLYASASLPPNRPDVAELQRRWLVASAAMEKSGYSPLRRAIALGNAGTFLAKMQASTADDRREAARLFEKVLTLLPNAASKEDRNIEAEDQWYKVIRDLIKGCRVLDGNFKAAFNRVDPVLAKIPALKVLRLQVKAMTLSDEGWEARGNGMADAVKDQAFQIFNAKHQQGYELLKQAWAANPKNFRTPTLMMFFCTSLGLERDEMETWFQRAMELKDDNAIVCGEKLNYLDPKWYGSYEEMKAFAQACKDTKNWRGGITVEAAKLHPRWTMLLEPDEGVKYFYTPATWEDGKAIFEEYLSHYTTDNVVRSDYAGFAYFCGRRADAAKQFKLLGDNVVGSNFYPLAQLMRFKASLENEERIVEEAKAAKAELEKAKAKTPKN
jgi:hypothetical protein